MNCRHVGLLNASNMYSRQKVTLAGLPRGVFKVSNALATNRHSSPASESSWRGLNRRVPLKKASHSPKLQSCLLSNHVKALLCISSGAIRGLELQNMLRERECLQNIRKQICSRESLRSRRFQKLSEELSALGISLRHFVTWGLLQACISMASCRSYWITANAKPQCGGVSGVNICHGRATLSVLRTTWGPQTLLDIILMLDIA